MTAAVRDILRNVKSSPEEDQATASARWRPSIFSYLNERGPSGARNVLRAIADAVDSVARNLCWRGARPIRMSA
jgi:hypothetical protein